MSPWRSARCAAVAVLVLAAGGAVTLAADDATPAAPALIGQGTRPCSEFNELVNGDWSHPLNALNFHGFLSWALGALSQRGDLPGEAAGALTEAVKEHLVRYCAEQPAARYADAVAAFGR